MILGQCRVILGGKRTTTDVVEERLELYRSKLIIIDWLFINRSYSKFLKILAYQGKWGWVSEKVIHFILR